MKDNVKNALLSVKAAICILESGLLEHVSAARTRKNFQGVEKTLINLSAELEIDRDGPPDRNSYIHIVRWR